MGKRTKSLIGRIFHRFREADEKKVFDKIVAAQAGPAIFQAEADLLTEDEIRLLRALCDGLPEVLLPAAALAPSALARAMGQTHTGNLWQLVKSLECKGFIRFKGRESDMFHVKQPHEKRRLTA